MTVRSSSAMNAWPSPSPTYAAARFWSSRRTMSYCPNVGEPIRMSTTTSTSAPEGQVTYFAWLGGSSAKCTPRTVPAADTEQLACISVNG